jgi:hypothetical protein
VEGIDRTRWRGWGKKIGATGRGFIVVVAGQNVVEYSASITATGFWSTHHFLGADQYFSEYTKLRVHVSDPGWRGQRNLTLDVPIQE